MKNNTQVLTEQNCKQKDEDFLLEMWQSFGNLSLGRLISMSWAQKATLKSVLLQTDRCFLCFLWQGHVLALYLISHRVPRHFSDNIELFFLDIRSYFFRSFSCCCAKLLDGKERDCTVVKIGRQELHIALQSPKCPVLRAAWLTFHPVNQGFVFLLWTTRGQAISRLSMLLLTPPK